MNLNKGCIEIFYQRIRDIPEAVMNLNKGCIEIYTCVVNRIFVFYDEP